MLLDIFSETEYATRHLLCDVNSTNNQHPILSLFFLNFENMVTRLSIFCFLLLMKYIYTQELVGGFDAAIQADVDKL